MQLNTKGVRAKFRCMCLLKTRKKNNNNNSIKIRTLSNKSQTCETRTYSMFPKHYLGLLTSLNITHLHIKRISANNTWNTLKGQVFIVSIQCARQTCLRLLISFNVTHFRIKHISAETHLKRFERQRAFIILFRADDKPLYLHVQ